jgi:hypothetical protein
LAWPAVQPDPTPGVPLAPSSPHAPLSLSHFLFPCSNFPLPLFHLPCPRCDPVDGCRRSSSPEVSSASHLLSLLPLSPARGLPARRPRARPPCPTPPGAQPLPGPQRVASLSGPPVRLPIRPPACGPPARPFGPRRVGSAPEQPWRDLWRGSARPRAHSPVTTRSPSAWHSNSV